MDTGQIKIIPAMNKTQRERLAAINASARKQQAVLPIKKIQSEILKGKTRISPQIPKKQSAVKIDAAIKPEIRKTRVAAYCRVSTGSAQQEISVTAQKEHYESYIRSNSDWEFAGVYWESDVSGTNKEKRPELNRLIRDCGEGRIDLILTKSISRFARNTTDCLEMVRTLTDLGVNIIFEKENIHTGTMESELMLSLFSSFAEEESKSISANIVWAKKKQFMNEGFKYSKAPFGYKLVDGNFEVDPERAMIVKEIFQKVLSGKGTPTVAKELNARSVPTGTTRRDGSPGVWTAYMVGGIIKNVAYIGDVIHQKTYCDHFHRKRNRGEREQFYNEGHHEPIIDKKTYERANAAMRQRAAEKGISIEEKKDHDPHRNRYVFSGKLKCAHCGAALKRVTQYTAGGKRFHWACTVHLADKNRCQMKRERETNIRNAFETMMNKLSFSHDTIIDVYALKLAEAENKQYYSLQEKNNQKLQTILKEKKRLTTLIQNGCGESLFLHKKLYELDISENAIRSEMNRTPLSLQTVEELKDAISGWKKNNDLDDAFSKIVESAVVDSGGRIVFHLRCGMRLTEYLSGEFDGGGK